MHIERDFRGPELSPGFPIMLAGKLAGEKPTMVRAASSGIEQAGKLNSLLLKKLGPGAHSDGGGLYLVVQESGSRSWILRTMVRGKRREIGLGGLSTTTLAEARQEASRLRARARSGEDILARRRIQKRAVPTFEEAAKLVHKKESENFRSERHAHNWLRSLDRHVFPVFGNKAVDTIDTDDVVRAIGPIWIRVPETARRTLRRVKKVLDYCESSGYRNVLIEDGKSAIPRPNPCAGVLAVLPANAERRPPTTMPYAALPAFIGSLRKSNSSLFVKLSLEFAILTAARPSEILVARWVDMDLEKKVWSIPGRKTDKSRAVPLPWRAIEILKLAREFSGGDVVFPGRTGKPLSNMALLMFLRRTGQPATTVHGFRRCFKAWAEEKTRFDSRVIALAMGHTVHGIEPQARTLSEQHRKVMDQWASFVTGATSVSKRRQ